MGCTGATYLKAQVCSDTFVRLLGCFAHLFLSADHGGEEDQETVLGNKLQGS